MKEDWIRAYNTLFEEVVRIDSHKKVSIGEIIIKVIL